jgi:AcrR family transcriptional regulator
MVRQADRTAASVASIVASARGLFAKHGYHDVTIDQVAIGAGVAKGSVYYHFGSKLDLLDHLVDTLQQEIATAVAASARSAASSPGTLTAGVRAYLVLANRPAVRRIVLIDGPAVLGWKRWRGLGLQRGNGEHFTPPRRKSWRLGNDSSLATMVAFLYGDTAATEMGFTPLGIEGRVGYEHAVAMARIAAG